MSDLNEPITLEEIIAVDNAIYRLKRSAPKLRCGKGGHYGGNISQDIDTVAAELRRLRHVCHVSTKDLVGEENYELVDL